MENNEKPWPVYETPAVVYEATLEVRAGTAIGGSLPDLLDPAKGE